MIAVLGAALAITPGCGSGGGNADPDAGPDDDPDAMNQTGCDLAADDDGDCIPNGVEGCGQMPPPDRDGDGTPDYQDPDSDNDNLSDELEAGEDCGSPRDNDGDGTPDYRDRDSDNDGVDDGDEDRNGDGVVGTCTQQCTQQSHCPPEANCSLPVNGEGFGTCISVSCQNGETDPLNPDTDGDGTPDGQEGTNICIPPEEDDPFGLKPIKYVDSANTDYANSNWRLALDVDAVENAPAITSPTNLNAAYTFDMIEPNAQVAGFLASRNSGAGSAVNELDVLLSSLEGAPFVDTVTVRASGSPTTSLDGFETVLGAEIEVTTTSMLDVTAVREIVLPVALARPEDDVTFPDPGWVGTADSRFVISVQVIRRAEDVQTLFVGGVARASDLEDITKETAFHLADMSNGTGVSVSGNDEAIECEQFLADQQAKADIIFVVDESGSTSGERENISNTATLFFNKAVAAGLDFRIGVTAMDRDLNGLFSTRQSGGTGDRWLLPTEQADFEDAINDPSGPDDSECCDEHGLTQGRAAIMRHLPRNNADPQMIREDAILTVIYVTDEKADEVEDAGILGEGNEQPDMAGQAQLDTLVADYVTDFTDNNAKAHLISEPLPFGDTCAGSEHAYGYYTLVDATGGQRASICQSDLSATIDAILEDIIGSSSPIVLSKFPISASISVSRDGQPLGRSRESGFDFRGSSNSIIFFNQPFDPANPSEIVVSYRRWADQVPVE